jgi:hypothetical protein
MSIVMAKNNKTRSRSAYQTHVMVLFSGKETKNVIDMTERKLIRIATTHVDENIRKVAARMLQDYVSGKIAVAWEEGILPIYIFIKS